MDPEQIELSTDLHSLHLSLFVRMVLPINWLSCLSIYLHNVDETVFKIFVSNMTQ